MSVPLTFEKQQHVLVGFAGGGGYLHGSFAGWHPAGPMIVDDDGSLIVCLNANTIGEARTDQRFVQREIDAERGPREPVTR